MKKHGENSAGNRFYRCYLRMKYNLASRLINGVKEPIRERGLLLIQVDGLSVPVLEEALDKGYMPTLSRLAGEKGYRIHSTISPLPSNTPFIQAGLLYGHNDGILGFRWMEKESGRVVTFKEAASAALVEDRLKDKGEGLLTGGSSYLNMYSGSASRSVFTLSTFAIEKLKEKHLKQLDIFIIHLLYLTNLARTVISLFIDAGLEFIEWFASLGRKRRGEGLFPLVRLINNVFFREVETTGAVTDLMHGVPIIYVTYNGYDEMAHHRGVNFRGALRVLRGIDRKLKRLVIAAEGSSLRSYDIFIFSDHGQTPSTPFIHRYGESLSDFIESQIEREVDVVELNAPHETILHEGHKYMEEAANLALNLPRFLYNSFELIRAFLMKKHPQLLPVDLDFKKGQVVVSDSGPLSHIYFTVKKEKLTIGEIERYAPSLIGSLVAHPGIGLVIGYDDELEAVVLKKEDTIERAGEEAFLRLAGEPYAGDIILQGAFDGNEIINFEEQLSAHGGYGGDQNRSFFISPPGVELSEETLSDPKKIYRYFFNSYTKRPREGDGE